MTPAKVLLIESDRTTVPSHSSALLKKGFALLVENSPGKAADRARATKPDVVVLDAISLHTSGLRLCRHLHKEIDGLPDRLDHPRDPFQPGGCRGQLRPGAAVYAQKTDQRRSTAASQRRRQLHSGGTDPDQHPAEKNRVRRKGRPGYAEGSAAAGSVPAASGNFTDQEIPDQNGLGYGLYGRYPDAGRPYFLAAADP